MRISHPHRWMLSATLLGWWGFIALQMVRAARLDPGPTGQPGDMPNLHNWPGDLQHFVRMSLIELALVTVILRPWSYRRSGWRALGALVLLVPWTTLAVIVLIHSGTIMLWHAGWLLGLLAGAAYLTIRDLGGPAPAAGRARAGSASYATGDEVRRLVEEDVNEAGS
jgi:hypothetical protein